MPAAVCLFSTEVRSSAHFLPTGSTGKGATVELARSPAAGECALLREAATRRLGFDPGAPLERRGGTSVDWRGRLHIAGMLWRISPARSGAPDGPVSPCPPSRCSWRSRDREGACDRIHEVKHDGYRLLASKAADRVTLWSRYGTDFTGKLPRIAEAVRSLPIDDALLDGEAVVLRPDGHSDFGALRPQRQATSQHPTSPSIFCRIEREDPRKLALEVRRTQLESLVAGINAITFSEAIYGEGAIVFAKACEMGLEGIVSKRLGGVYSSGPCRNWVKVKNPAFLRT